MPHPLVWRRTGHASQTLVVLHLRAQGLEEGDEHRRLRSLSGVWWILPLPYPVGWGHEALMAVWWNVICVVSRWKITSCHLSLSRSWPQVENASLKLKGRKRTPFRDWKVSRPVNAEMEYAPYLLNREPMNFKLGMGWSTTTCIIDICSDVKGQSSR